MQLTDKQLMRACCRALYLWEFGDDEVEPKHRLSDMELMKIFSGDWLDYRASSKAINYTQKEVIALILNCQLRKTQINNKNIPNICTYLMLPTIANPKPPQKQYFSVQDRVNQSLAMPKTALSRWEYARNFTKELSDVLDVRKGSAKKVKGGRQKAFASRILFFAMPHMSVYNISTPLINNLKKKYKLKGDTTDAIYAKMDELYRDNLIALRKLPRPKFSSGKGLAKAIKEGDWWERRVLDLAVLQNWKCFCRE